MLASSRGLCGYARSPGRIWNPPLRPTAGLQPPVKSRTPHCCNLCRGRCLHRPGQPRGGAGSRGRIWNPPLRPRAGPVDNRETTFPRHAARLVGADARIGPGNPAPPQTPAGGPWPSPTDHGIRPGGAPRPVSGIAVSKRQVLVFFTHSGTIRVYLINQKCWKIR